MKISYSSVLLVLAIFIIAGCNGKGKAKKESKSVSDTITVPDTGGQALSNIGAESFLLKKLPSKMV